MKNAFFFWQLMMCKFEFRFVSFPTTAPWGDRHVRLLRLKNAELFWSSAFRKEFHISPKCEYKKVYPAAPQIDWDLNKLPLSFKFA